MLLTLKIFQEKIETCIFKNLQSSHFSEIRHFIEMLSAHWPGKMKLVCGLEKPLPKMQMSLEVATEDFIFLWPLLEHLCLSTVLINPLLYSRLPPSNLLLAWTSVFSLSGHIFFKEHFRLAASSPHHSLFILLPIIWLLPLPFSWKCLFSLRSLMTLSWQTQSPVPSSHSPAALHSAWHWRQSP